MALSITTLPLCWMSICWVPGFIYCYAECHCDECIYAEWRYAECSDANTLLRYKIIYGRKTFYDTNLIARSSISLYGSLSWSSLFLYGSCPWSSIFHMGLYIDVPSSLLLSFSSWVPSLGAPSFFKDLALEAPSSIWVFILMSPLPCRSLSLYEPLYFSSLFLKGPLSWCSSLLKGLLSKCSLLLPLFAPYSLSLSLSLPSLMFCLFYWYCSLFRCTHSLVSVPSSPSQLSLHGRQ